MYTITKLAHLVAAIVWMGGMAFMLLALRPAAIATLQPPVRAQLMVQVWQRFFAMVWVAIAVLLISGIYLYSGAFVAARVAASAGANAAGVPVGWHAMMGLGIVMVLIFGHIYFASFAKYKRAVAAADWPGAAAAAARIHPMVVANFIIGWVAIFSVHLLR